MLIIYQIAVTKNGGPRQWGGGRGIKVSDMNTLVDSLLAMAVVDWVENFVAVGIAAVECFVWSNNCRML